MTKVKNFSENVEKGLARLGHEVTRQMELPDRVGLTEREIVKKSLKSFAREETNLPAAEIAVSAVPALAPISTSNKDFLPNYLTSGDSDGIKKSLEHLLQIVTNEDIEKAVNEARKYPPFVEDAFHDALIDKFLPELKKR